MLPLTPHWDHMTHGQCRQGQHAIVAPGARWLLSSLASCTRLALTCFFGLLLVVLRLLDLLLAFSLPQCKGSKSAVVLLSRLLFSQHQLQVSRCHVSCVTLISRAIKKKKSADKGRPADSQRYF